MNDLHALSPSHSQGSWATVILALSFIVSLLLLIYYDPLGKPESLPFLGGPTWVFVAPEVP